MRSVLAISTAIALFASSALAAQNADFEPVNFVAEEAAVPASLTDAFVTFRWKGDSTIAAESFDLNLDTDARIQVTDFKNRGDMFEVFDNGKSLGVTTKVDNVKDEEVFAATPEEALKDDRFSKGTFDLSKGPHKITIKATGPYEAGTAAIRVLDHDNVAFHKKNKHHHDGDDEDNDDDDNDDDDDDEDDDDEDDHKKKWNKDDDEDEDEKNKWEKKPTNEDIDLSHTVTYTKTKWVKAHHHKPTPY